MLKMADMLAGRSKDFDEPETVTCDVIMPRGVLLGVSDEESAADVLNIERSEAARNSFSFERLFTKGYWLEIGVIDFDAGLAEIGDVQEAVSVDLPARCAFIDGAIGPALFGVVDFQDGVDGRRRRARGEVGAGIPAGDGTVFRDKDENGGLAGLCALIQDEIGGAAVKDHSRRSGLCTGGKTGRRDDDKVSRNAAGLGEDVDGIAAAIEEAGGAGVVVADPPWASARGAGQPPRVRQIRVNDRRHPRNVGDEVRLFVMLRLRYGGEQEKRKSKNGEKLPRIKCGQHLRITPKRK